MQVKKTNHSETSISLNFSLSAQDLEPIKKETVEKLAKDIKVPGFRAGKVPSGLAEKNIDESTLQTTVIEEAVNKAYLEALQSKDLRPVGKPNVSIKKFAPFTELEFSADVEVLGKVKLGDYTKINKTKPRISVTDKDIDEVLKTLKQRMADKKDVERPAKKGDQIWIDFKGVDSKKQPVKGAEGKDYPLILGSDTFIPGFEENLIGMKATQNKTFTLTFPKEYGVKALAGKKVTFTVDVTKVQEVVEPKLDDDMAKKAGPFKTLEELKADIRKQVAHERQHEADRKLEQELVENVTSKSEVVIPPSLIEEQIEAMMRELRQNLTYRGQTYQEFLDSEGLSDEDYRNKQLKPKAQERVKAGLVLSEVAEKEGLQVTPEELEIRIQMLKGQYQDQAMQAELDKPENRRDIAMRLLTEKTLSKLAEYAFKEAKSS